MEKQLEKLLYGGFHTVVPVSLPERMKQQLLWSRTVNVHGQPGNNIPMDLHLEHLNRQCKSSIAGLDANVTDCAVTRIGKCLGEMLKVAKF